MIVDNTVLHLKLSWTEIAPVYQSVLTHHAKHVKAAGFRPGKTPPEVAESMISEEHLKEETAKKLVPAAYEALIKKEQKKPITQPEFRAIKIDKGSDWEFEVHIAEKPVINLKDYAKLVKKTKAEALKEYQAQQKAQTQKSDAAADTTKNAAPQPPQPTQDEFLLQAIFRQLVMTYKPQVPELLLKQETRHELEDLVQSLDQMNIGLDSYLSRRNISFEQLSNEIATQAMGRLQLDLLYSGVIEDQKLEIKEADLDTFVQQIKDEKERSERRQDPNYLRYITPLILRQKVTAYLLSL